MVYSTLYRAVQKAVLIQALRHQRPHQNWVLKPDPYTASYALLLLDTQEAPNCPGNSDAQTDFTFAHPFIRQNISNIVIARSLRLNHTPENQEQLDISVASNFAVQYLDKHKYSYNGFLYTDFLQSYYTMNRSMLYHNTPPFIYNRLQNNL